MPIYISACITVVYIYPGRNISYLFRKSVKRYFARFTLLLSARERAMNVIGYNYLGSKRKLYSTGCLSVQHLSGQKPFGESTDENFIRFWSLFPLNCITLRSSIFLLRREVAYHTTSYFLLTLPISRNRPSEMPLHSIIIGRRLFAISFGGFRLPIHLFPREISYCRKVMKNMKYDNEIR